VSLAHVRVQSAIQQEKSFAHPGKPVAAIDAGKRDFAAAAAWTLVVVDGEDYVMKSVGETNVNRLKSRVFAGVD
jgi:hypothetical protein